MPTRRQERVNERLVREVSQAIRLLKDPRIGFTTVTRAEVSPDLRHAKIFVSFLGPDDESERSMEALVHSGNHLRQVIGKELEMKVTPRLEFILDCDARVLDEMGRLIKEARATDPVHDDESAAPDSEEE